MSKAVLGGLLRHWSPSQVQTFSDCPRKWGFDKIDGVPRASTGSQALGTAIHTQMEDWVLEGKTPEHASALKAVEHIPVAGPGVLVEAALEHPPLLAAGVPAVGFIDLLDVRDPGHVAILDYKTCKNFRYVKTPDELARNIQMVTYAAWSGQKFGARRFSVSHIYIKTEGAPAARIVTAQMDSMDVAAQFANIERTVSDMKDAAKADRAMSLRPEWSHCSAYGGCPYRTTCSLSPERGFSAMFAADPFARTPAVTTQESPMPRATGINPPDAAKPAPRVAPTTESTTPVPAAGSQSSTSDALVIYVNCMPVRGVSGATNLSDEIAKRTAEIVTAHGAADLNSKPLDFGRGLGLLADSFRERPLTGPVLATQGGLSTRILETLEPLAAVVVKGVA